MSSQVRKVFSNSATDRDFYNLEALRRHEELTQQNKAHVFGVRGGRKFFLISDPEKFTFGQGIRHPSKVFAKLSHLASKVKTAVFQFFRRDKIGEAEVTALTQQVNDRIVEHSNNPALKVAIDALSQQKIQELQGQIAELGNQNNNLSHTHGLEKAGFEEQIRLLELKIKNRKLKKSEPTPIPTSSTMNVKSHSNLADEMKKLEDKIEEVIDDIVHPSHKKEKKEKKRKSKLDESKASAKKDEKKLESKIEKKSKDKHEKSKEKKSLSSTNTKK